MAEFETTKLMSKNCPDCGDQSLILGVEFMGGVSIEAQYQIYCKDEDECGFTHTPAWIQKVYTSKYNSVEAAKQEAVDRAYSAALEQFEKDF